MACRILCGGDQIVKLPAGFERMSSEVSRQEVGEDGIFVDEHGAVVAVVGVVVFGRVAYQSHELRHADECAAGWLSDATRAPSEHLIPMATVIARA